ncbi:3800_t:CDS:2 [Dentiscutata erythropus]|uniref:3800_t:CDS:1 n=1 Tax=Dentiscutata erythropus TaxID=1348616 RepID=A0A9N9ECR3_9GLOM|nr:3800_t:CDS:2 [Dentiscutata erythropus]
MSILKGALERLLVEAQSWRQKELEQACTTALEQLQQEINYIAKKKAIKNGKLKAKVENDTADVAPIINNSENGSIPINNTINNVPKSQSSTNGSAGETSQRGAEKAAEKAAEKVVEKDSKPNSSSPKHSPSLSQANSRLSISSSLFARAGEDLPKILADNYWQPFRISCGTSIPTSIRVLALDCLQKIIAHGLLKGSSPIIPPKNSVNKKRDSKIKSSSSTNGFSESNDLSFIDISDTPFDNDDSTNFDNVHTVCIGFTGPQTDQTVQLQILKVLLTLVTTEQCPVHENAVKTDVSESKELTDVNEEVNLAQDDEVKSETIINEVTENNENDGNDGNELINKDPLLEKVEIEKTVIDDNGRSSEPPSEEELKQYVFVKNDEFMKEDSTRDNSIEDDHIKEGSTRNVSIDDESMKDSSVKDDQVKPDKKDDNDDKTQTKQPLIRRRSSSTAMKDLTITIPTIIKRRKSKPKEKISKRKFFDILRKDLYLTFRMFCLFSLRSEGDENSQIEEINIKGRSLVLELILSMLDNSGPVFHNDEIYIKLIRQSLCVSLSQNGVSSNEQLFELSLSNFLMLLRYYRAPLKSELEVLFNEIYLRFLDMSNATYLQKHLVLQGLMKICQKPQILLDIYLNYDCDISMVSVFERIVTSLSKVAQLRTKIPSSSGMSSLIGGGSATAELIAMQDKVLKLKGLKCMVAIVNSLIEWCKDLERRNGNDSPPSQSQNPAPDFTEDKAPIIFSKNPLSSINFSTSHSNSSVSSVCTDDNEDNPAQYHEMMSRKQTLREGIKLFNAKPQKGLNFLIEHGFLKNDTDSIIAFLLSTPGLYKGSIGEYLGESDQEAIKIMHAFVDRMDFTGLRFVDALRSFLQTFRLPGEAQKIDRIMEKFADRYCETNPDIFANADTAYILAYSAIILNTDQHSAKVKRRMDKNEFVKNNRGINNNNDLPDEFLGEIFDEIANNEIVMEEEQFSEVAKTAISHANDRERQELYEREISQMQKKSQALLKSNRQGQTPAAWRSASHADHVKPMFAVVCWPLMATLSLVFEEADNPLSNSTKGIDFSQSNQEAIELCLEGFLGAIRISSIFRMDVERDAFVSSLAKLTGLNHVDEMRPKNVAAIKTLLSAANSYGEGLQSSWLIVLKTVSTMERYQLIDSAIGSGVYNAEGVSGVDYSTQNGRNETTSNISLNTTSPTRQNTNTTRSNPLMKEFQSQSTIIAIDRIFTNSVKLSGDAIVHFFTALCAVSLEEVNSSRSSPRMFSLQRIVEIAYYNMSRIRFEWTHIWKILQPHFIDVGCHANNIVATFAIDSLRQLSMKFLERDELSHYNTQSEFMKPFEQIIKNNPSPNIHDLIIQSIIQMISARARNIKSGWKSIFVVFGRAASDENPQLVETTFDAVRLVYQKHLDLIGPAFVDFVNCLVEFAFNCKEKEFVNESIRMLQGCVKVLVKDVDNLSKNVTKGEQRKENIIVLPSTTTPEQVAASKKKLQHIEEEQFFLKWFPVVSGLSRLVIDSESQEIRNKALETLFEILKSTGHLFEINYWIKIFRNAIIPIFEDLKELTLSQQSSSVIDKRPETSLEIWIQTIRSIVDIYTIFHDIFVTKPEFLVELLDLLVALIKRRNERLGQTGIRCFHNLISRNGSKFDNVTWGIITTTLEDVFKWTTPNELLEIEITTSEVGDNEKNDIRSAKNIPVGGGTLLMNVPSNNGMSDSMSIHTPDNPQSFISDKSNSKFDIDFQYTVIKCGTQLIVIQTVQDLALNDKEQVRFLIQMSAEFRNRWLKCLYNSYKFARDFNANHDLRRSLLKAGYVQQLPNLTKQETLSLSVFLSILFDLYRTFGDNDQNLLPPLIEESTLVLQKLVKLMHEPLSNQLQQRELNNWSPLVVTILRELCKTKWSHDRVDVRVAIQEFLEKVGDEFLNVD